jgi:hypothetical protein
VTVLSAGAQESFSTGQNIAPAYEGWEKNADGSFNLVFGYFNRNWDEEIDSPVGPTNSIEPGGPDRGQPTHFLPRRNRFVFKIRVPADFGSRELMWTLTTNGKTVRAYGTLKPDYFNDDDVIMANNGAAGMGGADPALKGNKPPALTIEGPTTRAVKVGEALTLSSVALDVIIPRPRAMPALNPGVATRFTVDSATGLRLSWFVYRGKGTVVFDPVQTKALVTKYFGDVPRGNPIQRPSVSPVTLPSAKRLVMEDRVQVPRLYIQWPSVGEKNDDRFALSVLGAILSGPRTARLTKALVYDEQAAASVNAGQSTNEDVGEFVVTITPRPGHTVEELQKIVDEEVTTLQKAAPSDHEIQRAINQLEASFYDRMERVGGFGGKADQLNAYYSSTGNPDWFNEDLARYRALSASDIRAAAEAFLPLDKRVELTVMPEPKR